jgi:hypothetical protein
MGRPALACLGVGLVALLLSLINQFSAAELTPPLVRASVLASLLAVGLLLVATLWTRAVPQAPERVALEGPQGWSWTPACRRPSGWSWPGAASCC